MLTDAQIDAVLNEGRPQAWKRSGKGNLFRRWLDMTLTVFVRWDGLFGWCISHGKGRPRFSPGGYRSEADAAAAVWAEVNGNGQ